MTQQSETCRDEKVPPDIVSGEDVPLDTTSVKDLLEGDSALKAKDTSLSMEKSARDLDLRKFSLGSATLGWCIFLMMLCIIISLWKPDNELVMNGFEAFKLIVMTILGYIFGSNNSKPD